MKHVSAALLLAITPMFASANIRSVALPAAALVLVLLSLPLGAETVTSATTTRTTTSPVESTSGEHTSSRSQEMVDEDGNVITNSETYNSRDPLTGKQSSSATTSVEHPDGSSHTVEQERAVEPTGSGGSEVEETTTTTTVE